MRHSPPAGPLTAAFAAFLLLTGPAAGMAPAPSSTPVTAADPDYVAANELIAAERYAEAVPLLEKVIERDPDNADAWSQLGFASRKTRTWAKSEMYYAKALALDPKHEQAVEYMGEMYLETDRPELAKTMLDKLVKLCPDGCEARSELEVAFAAYARRKARK